MGGRQGYLELARHPRKNGGCGGERLDTKKLIRQERGGRLERIERTAQAEMWRVLLKTAAVCACAAVLSFALQACGYSSLLSKEENI